MKNSFYFKSFAAPAISIFFLFFTVSAQTPISSPTPPPDTNSNDEVIRVGSNLIQTSISVFDKKGKFVKDLKQEDFELRVNDKPVALSFFEIIDGQVIDSTATDAKSPSPQTTAPITANTIVRGRNIIFMIDDIHLSPENTSRVRKMLLNFIENEKQPEDIVAIVSSTGKIGFLQQFTNDDLMLKAAAGRVVFSRDFSANDRSIPPLSEFVAQLISRNDYEVTNAYAGALVANGIALDLESAKTMAQTRARNVLLQAEIINRRTYETLEQTVRAAGDLPGRKTVFFISDGFVLDLENSNSSYRMDRIIDAAARNNAVIYSIDAKGLDANVFPNNPGESYRVIAAERFEKNDGMYNLAERTGGKLIQNTNDMKAAVVNTLDETSRYYLLAWQPESQDEETEKFRKVEIKIKNRPELKIRTQNGYLTASNKRKNNAKKAENKTADSQPVLSEADQAISKALTARFPEKSLPTSIILNYLDLPNDGGSIAGAIKIDGNAIKFTTEGEKSVANLDLAGAIYDADGKRLDYFRKLLTIEGKSTDKKSATDVFYNFQNKLSPGLYQVRVAARDIKSGLVGNNNQWIEVPDLTKRKLSASSLIVTERSVQTTADNSVDRSLPTSDQTAINVDRIFDRKSFLRYIIFIYNAKTAKVSGKPSVIIKTALTKNKNVILSTQGTKIGESSEDLTRLFYGADLPLQTLAPGKYELSVSIYDEIAKSTLNKSVRFEVK